MNEHHNQVVCSFQLVLQEVHPSRAAEVVSAIFLQSVIEHRQWRYMPWVLYSVVSPCLISVIPLSDDIGKQVR